AEIKAQIAQSAASQDRDMLRQRLAKLTTGVAVVRVGGATESEISERRDRVLNALAASKAAAAEGIVPGGGAALLPPSKAVARLRPKDLDERAGIDILRRALTAPLRQIASNAGVDGAVAAGALLAQRKTSAGFDAQSVQYVDMLAAGIVDPAMVVRIAL